MRSDTHWLLYFCYDNGLLTKEQLSGLISNLDGSTNADACAQKLAQSGWVKDQGFLNEAIESAKKNARDGFDLPMLPGSSGDVEGLAGVEFPDYGQLSAMSDEDLKDCVEAFLQACQHAQVSDVHLTSGARPRVRHHRKIVYLSETPLPNAIAERMNRVLLQSEQQAAFEADGDLDYALSLEMGEADDCHVRFRANLLRHHKGISGVYHLVRSEVSSLEDLGFPNADNIRKLLAYHNGIILVTGPVGSGKTTTLASLIRELNQSRQAHIITVENPIEVMQDSQSSIVTQRQVGEHTNSFQTALKSALREDPDIIVIGEMRDLETIEMAVTAAETGHLVIATMHTRDAASTLNRMLDVFPASQQSQIRAMTAGSLRGILCQRLIPSTENGVALACELLVNTNAVANIIREGKDTGLENAMQTGRRQGMRTMNESIDALLQAGVISEAVADENRITPEKKA